MFQLFYSFLFLGNDATVPPLSVCLPLLLSLSQEEVLLSPFLSPFLSPRPGNGFPSFRYYANRLLCRSERDNGITRTVLLSSLRSLHPSVSHPSTYLFTFLNSIFFLPPLVRASAPSSPDGFALCVASHHLSLSSLLLTFIFLVRPLSIFLSGGVVSPPQGHSHKGCCYSITVWQGGGLYSPHLPRPPVHHHHPSPPPPVTHIHTSPCSRYKQTAGFNVQYLGGGCRRLGLQIM